jgi:hypothetical protein
MPRIKRGQKSEGPSWPLWIRVGSPSNPVSGALGHHGGRHRS